jgi:hypothetical protein
MIKSTKLDALQVNIKVMDFLNEMEIIGEPEIASEFMLSQLSYLVSTLSKAKQKEFFQGMDNCLNEVK